MPAQVPSPVAVGSSVDDARVSELEDTLQCLMNRFATMPSAGLADAVVSHLDQLISYPPSPRLTHRRRCTYGQLMPIWQTIARRLAAFGPTQTTH